MFASMYKGHQRVELEYIHVTQSDIRTCNIKSYIYEVQKCRLLNNPHFSKWHYNFCIHKQHALGHAIHTGWVITHQVCHFANHSNE